MNQPLISISAAQMLEIWKQTGLYEPLSADIETDYMSGIDLDTLLMHRIDAWYGRLFEEMPRELLPATEIAPSLLPERLPCGAVRVRLPERTVGVCSAMVDGWHRPAIIVDDPDSPRARAQLNRFSRGSTQVPVAVVSPDRTMTLYTPPPGNVALTSVKAIVMPEKGTFILTPAMFSRIPQINRQ